MQPSLRSTRYSHSKGACSRTALSIVASTAGTSVGCMSESTPWILGVKVSGVTPNPVELFRPADRVGSDMPLPAANACQPLGLEEVLFEVHGDATGRASGR